MTRAKIAWAAVVAVVLANVAYFAFQYFDHHDKVKDAGRPCTPALTTPAAGVALPTSLGDFTLPSAQALLNTVSQGKTLAVYALTPGSRRDVVAVRDAVVADLTGEGFTASATDQEPTYEAEGKFAGKLTGTIQIQPQCQNLIRVRYKFTL